MIASCAARNWCNRREDQINGTLAFGVHDQMTDIMMNEVGCPFIELPHILATSILRRLSDQPHDIINLSSTCRAAHAVASDPALWQQLCCTFSSAFQMPSAWHASSFQNLYLALVHPFRDLLRCRLWHSNMWPCGAYCMVALW
jgi:hypothetical protein